MKYRVMGMTPSRLVLGNLSPNHNVDYFLEVRRLTQDIFKDIIVFLKSQRIGRMMSRKGVDFCYHRAGLFMLELRPQGSNGNTSVAENGSYLATEAIFNMKCPTKKSSSIDICLKLNHELNQVFQLARTGESCQKKLCQLMKDSQHVN